MKSKWVTLVIFAFLLTLSIFGFANLPPFKAKAISPLSDDGCGWDPETLNSTFGLLGYGQDFNFSTELGIYWERPHPGPFQWEIVEKNPGTYNFTWADWYVNQAQSRGINLLATIFPYAEWDQNLCHQSDDSCNGVGFEPQDDEFFPSFMSIPIKRCKPCNLTAYRNFVVALVERYDGDGVDDMPNLCVPIRYYETLNEPSLNIPELSFFKGSVTDYVEILNVTYSAVKEACDNCFVLNGGVLGMGSTELSYFNQTISYGGNNFFDLANIHAISVGEYISIGFTDNLDALGINKPIWMTEVSFYSLDPEGKEYRSLDEQAKVFAKGYAIGMAKGRYKKLFYTSRTGKAGTASSLDTEALTYENGTKKPIYYAYQTFVRKLNYFNSGVELYPGQYRFNVSGNLIYVLWNKSGPLPSPEIFETHIPDVNITYLNGTTVTKDLDTITLTDEPIFLELIEETGTTTTTLPTGIPGDTNGDGTVSDMELLMFIEQWSQGLVDDMGLLIAIEYWAT